MTSNSSTHPPLSTLKYIDIDRVDELPAISPGMRYLDFMGGTRALRCYILPEAYARCRFLARYGAELDEVFQPVYDHNGVVVRQDTSYAVPGFYIVSCSEHFRALDSVPQVLSLRVAFILREVRSAMRTILGIQYIHLHSEEKPAASTNVHFWLLPVQEFFTTVLVTNDIRQKLAHFRLSDHRETILSYNDRLRRHFSEQELAATDDRLTAAVKATLGGSA